MRKRLRLLLTYLALLALLVSASPAAAFTFAQMGPPDQEAMMQAQMEAMMQQAEEARLRGEAIGVEITALSGEFSRLSQEIKDKPKDKAANEPKLTRIEAIKNTLPGLRNELNSHVAQAAQLPPEAEMDATPLIVKISEIDDLINQIVAFQKEYGESAKVSEAVEAFRASLDDIRLAGQTLKSTATDDPMKAGLMEELDKSIASLNTKIGEAESLLQQEQSPELEEAIEELIAQRTELEGHRESIHAFKVIAAAMDRLKAEASALSRLVSVYEEPEEFPKDELDPWERYNILMEEINLQKTYLQNRLQLMDSRSPGYVLASDSLREFILMEEAHVNAGVPPHRPEMDVFLSIREESGKVFALSNLAYSLVSPEAEAYVDAEELKRASELIDNKYRAMSWEYFYEGIINREEAEAGLAELQELSRDFNGVVENLTAVLSRPEDPRMLMELALAWQTQGDMQAAMRNSRSALQLDGERADSNYTYGMLLMELDSPHEALPSLEKAAALDPQMIETYPTLAKAYKATGDPSKGLEAAEKGIALNPRDLSLYDAAGEMHQALGKQDDIKVYVEGGKPAFDVAPLLMEGRTMVPFRAIAESLGGNVLYDTSRREVVVEGRGKTIRLPLGQNHAYINGEQVPLDVPASIVDGRTLVPLRFLGEALDTQVDWLPQWKTVSITMQ